MNTPNLLRALGARLYSAELSAAAWIDTRPIGRVFMLAWYHQATVVRVATVASAMLLASVLFPFAASSIVLLLIAAAAYTAIADKSHEVINEENGRCLRCPVAEDGSGDGGVWLDWDSNESGPIPSAPAPMPDLDDDRIRAMAGDLDGQLFDLIADTRRAEAGEQK